MVMGTITNRCFLALYIGSCYRKEENTVFRTHDAVTMWSVPEQQSRAEPIMRPGLQLSRRSILHRAGTITFASVPHQTFLVAIGSPRACQRGRQLWRSGRWLPGRRRWRPGWRWLGRRWSGRRRRRRRPQFFPERWSSLRGRQAVCTLPDRRRHASSGHRGSAADPSPGASPHRPWLAVTVSRMSLLRMPRGRRPQKVGRIAVIARSRYMSALAASPEFSTLSASAICAVTRVDEILPGAKTIEV